jgi:hypothetical protein
VSESRITYAQRPDTTPETELSALASVYRFILDCHTQKEAAPQQSRPEDAKGSQHDRAKISISETN